jgi:uncharacterized protein YwgA
MNPIILGKVLRNFYNNFDMNEFDDRLKLQKMVYLMKSKDLNLGYAFNLYLYGPYSPDLTKDGFQISQVCEYGNLNKIGFEDVDKDEKFLEFISKIGEKKDDLEWLEIVSSYLFIKNNMNLSDDEIVQKILNKREGIDITADKINEVINEINIGGYFV